MARGDGDGAAAAAGRPAVEGDDRGALLVILFRWRILGPEEGLRAAMEAC